MPARLAIENPLLEDVKIYEPHQELAKHVAAILPDFMDVTLEPIEGTKESVITISFKWRSSTRLKEDELPTAEQMKHEFLTNYKLGADELARRHASS